jgi:hypothetical protein
MTFRDLFDLNERLAKENRFTEEQWADIVDEGFMHGNKWYFDEAVENFYTGWLDFDYEDCKDLITDIQNGDSDAFERFIQDIIYYFDQQ